MKEGIGANSRKNSAINFSLHISKNERRNNLRQFLEFAQINDFSTKSTLRGKEKARNLHV